MVLELYLWKLPGTVAGRLLSYIFFLKIHTFKTLIHFALILFFCWLVFHLLEIMIYPLLACVFSKNMRWKAIERLLTLAFNLYGRNSYTCPGQQTTALATHVILRGSQANSVQPSKTPWNIQKRQKIQLYAHMRIYIE